MGHSAWAHQFRRKRNRRDFGGRWQDRVPIRFPDPRPGESVRHYCKRIGYGWAELASMCKREGGDRIWRDTDDLAAWLRETGYTSPFRPVFHDFMPLVVRPFDFLRTLRVDA